MHLNSAMYAGAEQVLCADPDPWASLRHAARAGATHYYGLPARLHRLARDERLLADGGGAPGGARLTVVLSGGTALAPPAARVLSEHIGVPVVQGYGMAELSPLSHCQSPRGPGAAGVVGGVGGVAPGTECRIVHLDTRQVLGTHATGEVQIRGPQVMAGYLDAPGPAPVDADGWFSTGDVGHLNEDGQLFLVDRLGDVFKHDNELVSPSAVEAVLGEDPRVTDCIAAGWPDDVHGAVVWTGIVLRDPAAAPGLTAVLDSIVERANERLAPHERIRRAEVLDAVPRTPSASRNGARCAGSSAPVQPRRPPYEPHGPCTRRGRRPGGADRRPRTGPPGPARTAGRRGSRARDHQQGGRGAPAHAGDLRSDGSGGAGTRTRAPQPGVHDVRRGSRLVRLNADYRTMPTRYPYTVIIEQTRTEEVLRAAVARLGVTVEWGVRLTGIAQDRHGVRASLEHADGSTEEYDVPWLVGCDGGHSTVRKELRLPLIGESSETWELADTTVTTELPQDSIYWVHTGGQALMMVPYQDEGRWRLLDTAPRPGADPAQAAARFGAKLSAGLGHRVTVGAPDWSSVFTFQQRMVPRMQDGRCFVAGDAAHVHSPASGQGMNTGIQEAYNLAWKLAMVAQGQAGRELLSTYDEERVPIGRALLGSTRTATFLVQFKNTLAGVMLPVVFGVVRRVPPLRRAIQRKVLGGLSGLRIGYRHSSLTTTGSGRGIPRAPGPRRPSPHGSPVTPGRRSCAPNCATPGGPCCTRRAGDRKRTWSRRTRPPGTRAGSPYGRCVRRATPPAPIRWTTRAGGCAGQWAWTRVAGC